MNAHAPIVAPAPLVDPFGRAITYVRVSVTDRCDFRCAYCMAEDMNFLPKKDVLTLEELDRLCSAFIGLGTRKIRVTGGEPLVRRDIMKLFRSLSRHLESGALEELTLTTNGSQLSRYAAELKACGVERVNVSLDTLDPEKFRTVTRWGDLAQVLRGIDAAAAAGLKIKLNAVALKGFNQDEAASLVGWAHARGFDISFIEVMPLGDVAFERSDQYLPLSELRAKPVARLHADAFALCQRRPGALFRRRGDAGPHRLHHPAHPQFLRKLQSRARHLHRHALHVPRQRRFRRSSPAVAALERRRRADRGDPRGDFAQAKGPRFPDGARGAAGHGAAHERHRRLRFATSAPQCLRAAEASATNPKIAKTALKTVAIDRGKPGHSRRS